MGPRGVRLWSWQGPEAQGPERRAESSGGGSRAGGDTQLGWRGQQGKALPPFTSVTAHRRRDGAVPGGSLGIWGPESRPEPGSRAVQGTWSGWDRK